MTDSGRNTGCCLKQPEAAAVSKASCEAPRTTLRPLPRTTTRRFQTARCCAKRSRAWTVQARSPDKVLHHYQTTGGHAEAVGDGRRLRLCLPAVCGSIKKTTL
ncbi:MAG: hypothetical protein LBD24_00195 [Spirochaetaceae bacterium]|nr:hypothetical protein [Spirochaetaceae bacterium]